LGYDTMTRQDLSVWHARRISEYVAALGQRRHDATPGSV